MIKICSLFSGSSGNCIYVSYGDTAVLIDAGVSGKRIEEAMAQIGEPMDKVKALFITHEHSDHICGAGIIARRFKLPVFANKKTWDAMRRFMGKLAPDQAQIMEVGVNHIFGDMEVKSFPIPHDAACPVGYNFTINGKKITVATDIGHMSRELLGNMEGSDMILLESNHDIEMLRTGRYPWPLKQRILGDNGHLCNEMAGKVVAYLAESGTKFFVLGHLSQENNFPELAYETTKAALIEKSIHPDRDVYLEVALRDRCSKMLSL